MLQTNLVLKDGSSVTLGEASSRRLPSEQVPTYISFQFVKEEGWRHCLPLENNWIKALLLMEFEGARSILSWQQNLAVLFTWCWLWKHKERKSKEIIESYSMVSDSNWGQAACGRGVPGWRLREQKTLKGQCMTRWKRAVGCNRNHKILNIPK